MLFPLYTSIQMILKRLITFIVFYLFLNGLQLAHAQQNDSFLFHQPVLLDEVVIRATQNGFDISHFIHLIQQDTTFYKAFKTLRLFTYNADNDIRVYDKKGKTIKASLKSETKQVFREGCRVMHVLEEKTTGDFYNKDGSYRYFTAALYANLFFTKGKICGENNIVKGSLEREGSGKNRMQKSIIQLKHLIFNPGEPVEGVPFISKKIGIFEPEIAKHYHFYIKSASINGEDCYLFEAIPQKGHEGKVVIKEFKTWLRISDYAIVSRDYTMNYNIGIYDFDVKMHVDLTKIKNQLLPSLITFDGNWHVWTKKREIVKFKTAFYY